MDNIRLQAIWMRKLSGRNALLTASVTLLIGELVSVSLFYGGTSDISVLSAGIQEGLLSPEGTAIVFVAPAVLAAIAGLIAWNVASYLLQKEQSKLG